MQGLGDLDDVRPSANKRRMVADLLSDASPGGVASDASAGSATTIPLDGRRSLENCHSARSSIRIRTPASVASDRHACVYAHQ